nr:thiol reductant ABC exporter subunit CydD [Texcoconibacillus texcoconensis]
MKQLNEEAFAQKRRMFLLIFLSTISGIVIIGQAYAIASIVNRVFLQGEAVREVIPLFAVLLLVFLIRGFIQHIITRTGIKMASKVKRNYRERLLHQYVHDPLQASVQGQSGQKVSTLMDVVDEVDAYFSSYFPQVIQTVIVPLMILVVVFTQNVYSGLIMLITAPLIPVFMILIGSMSEKKAAKQMEKMTRFSGHFLDTLQGLTTLKIFGRGKRERQSIHEKSIAFRETTMDVLKIAFLSALMLEILATISTAMIAVEVGLRLVYGQLTFMTAFFVLLLAPELYLPLKNLGSTFHTGRSSMAAAKTIADEWTKREKVVEWGENNLTTTAPPSLEVENVSFSYRDDQPVLKTLDFKVPSGSKVAIVGRSGAGKSTLLNLLSGLLPLEDGEIRVEGQPLTSYRESAWFDQLSYISQHPYLFSGTFADNIRLGAPEASQQEVERAVKKAGLTDMVAALPDGYETDIGEAGRGLSGGEMQRIALARAFLKQPQMILFDEPTVGLDLKTERILQESIHELSKGATVFIVAHRLYTIKEADQIILLEEGSIEAHGTHEQLLATSPRYNEMVMARKGEQA